MSGLSSVSLGFESSARLLIQELKAVFLHVLAFGHPCSSPGQCHGTCPKWKLNTHVYELNYVIFIHFSQVSHC